MVGTAPEVKEMNVVKEGSIGSILFKSQIITEQELRAALEAQKVSGCRVGEALVRLGVVTQEDIDWALANQLNIPYVRLKKENVDPAAVALVPAALARQYNLFPVVLSGKELSVAMADPLNREAVEALEKATGCNVQVSVGLIREIREMHDLVYGPHEVAPEMGLRSTQFPERVLETVNADISGGTLLNHLLLRMVKQKVDSLSLQPIGDSVTILARGKGKTAEIGQLATDFYPELTRKIRKLSKAVPEEGISASGVLTFMWQGRRIPFRALLIGGEGNEYVTLKRQISLPRIAQLSDLELDEAKWADLRSLTAEKEGLILFAGRDPEERSRLIDLFLDARDNSGKTVLLLGERLGRSSKRFPRIPVSHRGADDTASVLTAALEHDPDLLVVEDVTDVSAFIATTKAVLRGKLVLAGLSHNDKTAVLKQLLYLRQKNFLIPGHIKGIVSFKSVLILCPDCKERYTPSPEEIATLRLPGSHGQYCRPKGCPSCDHSGYSGRRYLLDVIRFDVVLEAFEMIGKSSEIISYMKDNGYRGITEEGLVLLERGEISPAEYVAAILL